MEWRVARVRMASSHLVLRDLVLVLIVLFFFLLGSGGEGLSRHWTMLGALACPAERFTILPPLSPFRKGGRRVRLT